MDSEGLTRLRAQRFAFLRAVYEGCDDGNTLKRVRYQEIAAELGFDEELAAKIAGYLVEENLLEWAAMGGWISLTHWGVVEVEEAIAAPEQETEHFPALVVAENYLHVGSMVGSAVQQGTQGSTQIVESAQDVEALRRLVAELRETLGTLALDDEASEEADADLATLEAQLVSSRPKRAILREGFASLQRIIEGALGAGLATTAPQLPGLAERLAHVLSTFG